MGWWSEQVVPRLVHASLSAPPVMEQRRLVCAGLTGRVLEVGFGSGLNLAVLPAAVTALDAVEPSQTAWRVSQQARIDADVPISRIGLDGQLIDATDGGYDTALVTFSLCTIPEPALALAELRRLIRPGGRLHVLEHGISPDLGVRRWQRRLDGLETRLADGCHLTRDPLALVVDAGFAPGEVTQAYLAPGPSKPWTYVTRTVATRR